MNIIHKYFPELTMDQVGRFAQLKPLYNHWNTRINVISRKDIDHLYEKHVLHSLGIARVITFAPETNILDVGTGGGFPGIPLAILFPQCQFHLIDSIGKKVGVAEEIARELKLSNVTCQKVRAEWVEKKFHFIVSRAVTNLPQFTGWVKSLIVGPSFNRLPNGILYLKGGDIKNELNKLSFQSTIYPLDRYFTEEFFSTKAVVHLYR